MRQAMVYTGRLYGKVISNPDLSNQDIEQFLKTVTFEIGEAFFTTNAYPYKSYASLGLDYSSCSPMEVSIDGDLVLTVQPISIDGRSSDHLYIRVSDPSRLLTAFQYLSDLLAPEGIKFQLVVKSGSNIPIPE